MDHFALPDGGHHIRVKNATSLEYSSGEGGFLCYPSRRNWSKEDLRGENSFGGRSAAEVRDFFQTWLYFGCVIEVLAVNGVKAIPAEFLDKSKRYITTKYLPSKIRKWRRKVQKAKDGQHERCLERCLTETETILSELSKYVNYYCATPGRPRLETEIAKPEHAKWPLTEEISMSIIALGYTLKQAMLSFHDIRRTGSRWGYSILLKNRMLAQGWCPMDVRRSLSDMGIDGHYYIAALPNPEGKELHASRGCTEDMLVAQNINESTYQMAHAENCDGCEDVYVDVSRVVAIMDAKGTPVICWSEAEQKLQVATFDKDKSDSPQYIAISHVWSDGMGNPTHNCLRRCQVSQIQKMVNAAAKSGKAKGNPSHFWMDTLCIPVAKDLQWHRKLAIQGLKGTYRYASAVLVLSSDIRRVPSTANDLQKSVCLYFCNWNHRLWTFQEGILANELLLQFKDQALSFRKDIAAFADGMHKSTEDGHCITFPNASSRNNMGEFDFLHEFLRDGLFKPIDHALPSIVTALQYRTTSKLADQTLCICGLMGLDPKDVLNAAGKGKELEKQRMVIFLSMLTEYPFDIIFNMHARVQREGFRWAPESLLGIPKDGFVRDDEGRATLTHKGLSLNSPGLFIPKPVTDQTAFSTQFTAHIPRAGREPLILQINVIIPDREKLQQPLYWARGEDYAVIMKTTFEDEGRQEDEATLGFPSGTVEIEDFLQKLNYLQASLGRPSHDAVIGIVREVKRDSGDGVEYIRLCHECLASIVLMNPSALLDGSWKDVEDDESVVTSALAKASVGDEGDKAGTDGDVGNDTTHTSIRCEFLHENTQWYLL